MQKSGGDRTGWGGSQGKPRMDTDKLRWPDVADGPTEPGVVLPLMSFPKGETYGVPFA